MQWEWLEAGNRIAGIKIKGIQDFAEIKDMSGIGNITEIKSAGNLEWVQWLSACFLKIILYFNWNIRKLFIIIFNNQIVVGIIKDPIICF